MSASETTPPGPSRTKTLLNTMKISTRRRTRRGNWAARQQAESSRAGLSNERNVTSLDPEISQSDAFSFSAGDEQSFSHVEQPVSRGRPRSNASQDITDEFIQPVPSNTPSEDMHEPMAATIPVNSGESLDGIFELTDTISVKADDPEQPETFPVLQEYSGNARKRRSSSAGDIDGRRPMLGNRARTTNNLNRLPLDRPGPMPTPAGASSQEVIGGSSQIESPPTASRSSQTAAFDNQHQTGLKTPDLSARPEKSTEKDLLERCKDFAMRVPSKLLKGKNREKLTSELYEATKMDVTRKKDIASAPWAAQTVGRNNNRTTEDSSMPVSSMLELEPISRPRSSTLADPVSSNRPARDAGGAQHVSRRVRWKLEENEDSHGPPQSSKRERCQHFVKFFFKHIFSLGNLGRQKKGNGTGNKRGTSPNSKVGNNSKVDEEIQPQTDDTSESPLTQSGPTVTKPLSRFEKWKKKWGEIRHKERGAWNIKVKQGETQQERDKKDEAWNRRVRVIELRGMRRLRRRNRQQNSAASQFVTSVSGPIFPSASSGHPSTEREMFEAGPAPR